MRRRRPRETGCHSWPATAAAAATLLGEPQNVKWLNEH